MLKPTTNQPLDPRFDWYQATAKVELNDVLEVMQPLTHDSDMRADSPKLKGYNGLFRMGGTGGSLMIHYGGVNGDAHGPNVQGTGPLSPMVAELLRSAEILHSVGRADVANDFLGDFDVLRALFVDECNKSGTASDNKGSNDDSVIQKGRSICAGSKTSTYSGILYEKGLQLGDGYPSNFLRLEHRFQFSKASEKQALSTMTPMEMLGLRPLSRALTLAVCSLAIDRYKLTKLPKVKDWYHWMLEAYGRHIREMEADLGSPAAFGCQVMYDLNEKAIKERMRSTH